MASIEEKDFKGRCSYCNKDVGRDKVKTCSRCRLVRYCSKECQVASWKTHKSRCTPRESYAQDPTSHALNTALSRWINNWRDELHNWCLWAFDLANHPADRLATHIFVIELERRPNPPSPSQFFKMHGGGVETREGLINGLRKIDGASDDTVACVNENRGPDTAQIVVLCEDLIRFLWFSLRDGGASFRNRDPAFSRAMAEGWVGDMKEAVYTGDPAASKTHLMKAAMRIVPPPA
ncbi:hypothetical protein BV22DRAFT_1035302 [Leucogyrophana mollusca]|uniref:Uncharacterized protein n=1 Tax=Leucogyrophana mollusca TaxID=85980 RepID=A0ACB8BFT8_9AGAM|nr:hypothetical protein BV22DRAFT_1035302 [Leucogyrophana mollusca]